MVRDCERDNMAIEIGDLLKIIRLFYPVGYGYLGAIKHAKTKRFFSAAPQIAGMIATEHITVAMTTVKLCGVGIFLWYVATRHERA